jgi:hypothetical protein
LPPQAGGALELDDKRCHGTTSSTTGAAFRVLVFIEVPEELCPCFSNCARQK